MTRNIIKILDKDFSDVKAGQRMLIYSPESICTYITNILVIMSSMNKSTNVLKVCRRAIDLK